MQLKVETGPGSRIDLSLALPAWATPDGVGELALAATLFAPDDIADDVRVLVCWPGGSYGRDYWDIRLPGHEGYSFAEHMTSRGFLVVAVDPLGVGDSGRPADGTVCTYEALAAAAHGAVDVLRARLMDGSLAAGLPPIAEPRMIGVGHSMGGGLVAIQQAQWGSYDAIAVLGYTHGVKTRSVDRGDDASLRSTALELAEGFWGSQWEAGYGVVDKRPHQAWLNGPDVPADIIAADNASGRGTRRRSTNGRPTSRSSCSRAATTATTSKAGALTSGIASADGRPAWPARGRRPDLPSPRRATESLWPRSLWRKLNRTGFTSISGSEAAEFSAGRKPETEWRTRPQ